MGFQSNGTFFGTIGISDKWVIETMSVSPLGTVSYRSSKTPELFPKLHSVALSYGHAGIYTTLKCLDADI